ncbi:MAG: hypothetical protein M1816_003557 [Peltula sp. TS41687]|nr:MAG: hypothetical protein M1816_003557 [Peltula sp. TS41687]
MASTTSQTYKTLSTMEIQSLGQEHYRKRNYTAALEAFTAAIEQADKPPVSLLDGRAATFGKLGNLSAALRDAKEMIRIGRAEGYLRAGKVLQLMGKPDLALAIYERGLNKLPFCHPSRNLLHGMCKKLRPVVKPATLLDPFLFLPVELAQMVVDHLTFIELVKCLRVSKGWNEYLTSITKLWTNLDLSHAKRPVRVASVKACLRRSRGDITRATLNGLVTLQGGILKLITANCRELQSLEICQGLVSASLLEAAPLAHRLDTLILSKQCEVTIDTVMYLLKTCRDLSKAEFHTISEMGNSVAQWPTDMVSLKELRLGSYTPRICSSYRSAASLSLETLHYRAPNLSVLSLHNWSTRHRVDRLAYRSLSELSRLDLQGNTMVLFPVLPASIRHLNLSDSSISCMGTSQCDAILGDLFLPNLHELDVSGSNAMTPALLDRLLRGSEVGLNRLAISHAPGSYAPVLADCLRDGLLENLVALEVAGKDVGDAEMELLAERAPALTRLDVSCTKVTGLGVKAVVTRKKGTALERLAVLHCDGVSLDAVTLARAAGVSVDYGFPDPGKKSRRMSTFLLGR